jgi:hypothetical protein
MRILTCGGDQPLIRRFTNSFDLLQSKYVQQANTPSMRVYLFYMIHRVPIGAIGLMLQCTLAICKHIKTTRLIIDEISHNISRGEGGLKDFTREKAPIAGK